MVSEESAPNRCYTIAQNHWQLRVARLTPTTFQVVHGDMLVFEGRLIIENNGQPINLESVQWKFRHRADRVEQWGQISHVDQLSINMNYYFHQGALVIEYLARNSIPTRLEIRHEVHAKDLSPVGQLSTPLPEVNHHWHRRRHGLPSDFLVQSASTDLFREAFSATQWIVLDKM